MIIASRKPLDIDRVWVGKLHEQDAGGREIVTSSRFQVLRETTVDEYIRDFEQEMGRPPSPAWKKRSTAKHWHFYEVVEAVNCADRPQ